MNYISSNNGFQDHPLLINIKFYRFLQLNMNIKGTVY